MCVSNFNEYQFLGGIGAFRGDSAFNLLDFLIYFGWTRRKEVEGRAARREKKISLKEKKGKMQKSA
jgi:hypothetical protein